MTKFLWHVSFLVVCYSYLWAFKDGCVPNVVIAIVATALACWSLSKEGQALDSKFDCLMDEPHCVNQNTEVGVVKHGRWIVKNDRIVCDRCEALWAVCPNKDVREEVLKMVYEKEKFCYNCGAKMDGKDNNNA